MSRVAVVLFNLGGPDRPEAVRPFLFNLFNDPAIIGARSPIRRLLASVISRRRAPLAREIYAHIGGKSPLVELTRAQGAALEAALEDLGEVRTFIAMRYWHPMSDEAARAVAEFQPEHVVLLPLYPQFSTTTTASSLAAWERAARRADLGAPSRAVCCYPTDPGLAAAFAELVSAGLGEASASAKPRVLFSAHGLPKRVIARGDPYQWQVERTAAAVVAALDRPDLDWTICYQSRVGPLEWIGPSTEDEIRRAGADGAAIVLVPIAFVSEHSETLVELDIEYRKVADAAGAPAYVRVPALGTHARFIAALAGIVRRTLEGPPLCSADGQRICPRDFTGCPMAATSG